MTINLNLSVLRQIITVETAANTFWGTKVSHNCNSFFNAEYNSFLGTTVERLI